MSDNSQNIITQLFVGFQIYIQKYTPAALQNCFLFTTYKVSGYQSYLGEQTSAIISADEKNFMHRDKFFVHSTCWRVLLKNVVSNTHEWNRTRERSVRKHQLTINYLSQDINM